MSKRRTRKEKVNAKHGHTISWEPTTKILRSRENSASIKADVKGQNRISGGGNNEAIQLHKKADNQVKDESFAYIRFDLIRSLGISIFIIIIELMIYSFWYRT
jgi:hypothetical protein